MKVEEGKVRVEVPVVSDSKKRPTVVSRCHVNWMCSWRCVPSPTFFSSTSSPLLSFVSHALFIDSPSLRGDQSFSCFHLQAALSGGHLVRSGKLEVEVGGGGAVGAK